MKARWRRAARWGGLAALLAFVGLAALAMSRSALEAPAGTAWLTDRHGALLGAVPRDAAGRLGYWPMTRRAWRVEAALLAIEDQGYWDHPGVDPGAVVRAAGQNLRHGRRVSGASTVAMQVARMQRPSARTWGAKIAEAATAIALVARNGRRAVLDHYLRIAPYGNNVHGVAFAARWYFGKPPEDLSWAETAFLCALPQAPGHMNPYDAEGRRRAKARGRRILAALRQAGRIDADDHAAALVGLRRLQVQPRPTRAPEAMHAVLALAGDHYLATTLDLDVQRLAQAEVRALLAELAADGAEHAAALVVELDGAVVRAAVGSADWFDPRAGALDYTRVRRSPGSTLKPFIFALGLEDQLIAADTPMDDLRRAEDGIGNADGRFMGPLLPAVALGNSRNVPAVELVERLGVDRVYGLLRRLGLHDDPAPASRHGLGLALGALPVRMVDLAAAYTALAGDGRLRPLRWTDAAEPVVGPRIFSAATARQITGFLADPMARLPSFPRLGHSELGVPMAIKTGTSRGYRDAWAVAWTPRYLVLTWVGRPDWRPMRGVSGYRAGARLASAILRGLHPEAITGLADGGFAPPEGWRPRAVCALSGKTPTAHCPHRHTVWAPSGAAEAPCAQHVEVAVDARTGGPATARTPPALRDRRTFVELPGRYAAWMASVGLQAPPGRVRIATLQQGLNPRLEIVSPRDGAELLRDPEAPAELGTIALQAAVDPPGAEILWTIDGRPLALAGPPYTVRWPLEPGSHRIEARLPYTEVATSVRIVSR